MRQYKCFEPWKPSLTIEAKRETISTRITLSILVKSGNRNRRSASPTVMPGRGVAKELARAGESPEAAALFVAIHPRLRSKLCGCDSRPEDVFLYRKLEVILYGFF